MKHTDQVTATPDDTDAILAKHRKELTDRGYVDIDEHRGLKVGARVHHIGEKWWEAGENGTATVVAILEKNPSSWSWGGRPDIELIAQRDDPSWGGPFGRWADYHTALATGPLEL
ncbi:hypothetical protein [Agromyces humi]|uniref:hypothetical protein n=1 Tax=Agromyces humi TaxID=1766800 RepID=UPI00135892CD|nr:hypothetical protein [Agromyces humi]